MSENLQLKPGHLWLELPVLFHRVTTTGQSSAPTILYMYCTGGTEMLQSYVYPTATPGCHSSVAEHKLHALPDDCQHFHFSLLHILLMMEILVCSMWGRLRLCLIFTTLLCSIPSQCKALIMYDKGYNYIAHGPATKL